MKRKILTILTLVALLTSLEGYSLTVQSQTNATETIVVNDSADPYFKNVVFITWDGTNYKALEDMLEWDMLPNTAKIDEVGYRQTVRITSHVTGTNPGLACMESGYGPDINMIPYNMFGEGTIKASIPDNLTIAERLKNSFGDDLTTMFVYAWQTDDIDMTYMNQDPSVDPIYNNMKDEIDMYFAAENISWVPGDPEAMAATYHGFSEDIQMYLSPVMRADYLSDIATDFLQNVTSERFYLRIHMTEPDQAGHGYGVLDSSGDYTAEYMQSLVDCDNSTGKVIDQLESMGVLNDTLFIIGADHGMYGHSHDGGVWPANEDEITTNTFIISNNSVETPHGVPAYQRDIAPTILSSMGINTLNLDPAYIRTNQIGVPFMDFDDTTAPNIKSAEFRYEGTTGYSPLDENAYINDEFVVALDVHDWCDNLTGFLTVSDQVIGSYSSSYKRVMWRYVDLSSLEGGPVTFNFTLIDPFGNSASLLVDTNINTTAENPAPILYSLIGIFVVATATYLKKKK